MGLKWGAQKCPRRQSFFVSNRTTRWLFGNFLELRNGRFSLNLATTRESRLQRRLWTEIYENFPFRGHLPPKPQTWRGSNRHTTQSRLPVKGGMHCIEILFTPRCSPKAREFPRSVNFFVRRSCGATGRQSCPIFGFWPIFPIQNA